MFVEVKQIQNLVYPKFRMIVFYWRSLRLFGIKNAKAQLGIIVCFSDIEMFPKSYLKTELII